MPGYFFRMPRLTIKQARFVDEYLICNSASEAARKAGYNNKFCGIDANNRLLKTPKILQAIEAKRNKLIKSGKIITSEQVLEEYTKMIKFDPGKLYDNDNNPINIKDLPEEIRLTLAGHEMSETITDDNGGKSTTLRRNIKYKYPDKKGVLDSIAKIHRLFNDRPIDDNSASVTVTLSAPMADLIQALANAKQIGS